VQLVRIDRGSLRSDYIRQLQEEFGPGCALEAQVFRAAADSVEIGPRERLVELGALL